MKKTLLVVLTLSLFAFGCSQEDEGSEPTDQAPSASSDTGASLEGVTWVLTADSAQALFADAPAEARVDLTFEMGSASGTAACNSYNTSYTVEGESITFGEIAATQMACEGPISELEAAYLSALGEVSGFSVSDGSLTLTGAATDLVYEAEQPAALTGTMWHATMINTGTEAVSPLWADAHPTAEFADDGTVSGTDGCNNFNGPYTLTGETIAIGPLAGTKMACDAKVQEQATAFINAMQAATTVELSGNELTLRDDDGAMQVVFSTEDSH